MLKKRKFDFKQSAKSDLKLFDLPTQLGISRHNKFVE